MIYLIDSLLNDKSCIKDALGNDRWVIARPIPDDRIMSRLRAAWAVFTMEADAVVFVEHPCDLWRIIRRKHE